MYQPELRIVAHPPKLLNADLDYTSCQGRKVLLALARGTPRTVRAIGRKPKQPEPTRSTQRYFHTGVRVVYAASTLKCRKRAVPFPPFISLLSISKSYLGAGSLAVTVSPPISHLSPTKVRTHGPSGKNSY